MEKETFLKDYIFYHRGYHNKKIPENSILAFKKSIDYQMGIELDIHLTNDNQIVVFHDDNLKRMTGVFKHITELTEEEREKIFLLNSKEHIPLLSDVLNIVHGQVPILIEVKSDFNLKQLLERLVNILDSYNGLFVIITFNPYILWWFNKHRKNYLTGELFFPEIEQSKTYLKIKNKLIRKRITKPDFLLPHITNINLKNYHKKYKLIGWTIKSYVHYYQNKEKYDSFICDNIIKHRKN